jgi:hypothetical protein
MKKTPSSKEGKHAFGVNFRTSAKKNERVSLGRAAIANLRQKTLTVVTTISASDKEQNITLNTINKRHLAIIDTFPAGDPAAAPQRTEMRL